MKTHFDEWFYELKGFSFTAEHFYEDVECEDEEKRKDFMKKWIEAAFNAGYEIGKKS